ncbi:MAG: hypothetical protein ACK2T4_08420 [Candidatus Promineifilaceae bacterium]|jgi:hypothetical protein
MGFLKKIFGGGEKKSSEYVDTRGVYFYVRCDNCGTIVKIRADKEYDLSREGDGFSWHKTIVDNRCFRSMLTVVFLDSNYNVVSAEISGGEYVTEEVFNEFLRAAERDAVEEDVSSEEEASEEEE